jgi:hypothetical protein
LTHNILADVQDNDANGIFVFFFLRLHNMFLWTIFSFATELEVPDSTLGENLHKRGSFVAQVFQR